MGIGLDELEEWGEVQEAAVANLAQRCVECCIKKNVENWRLAGLR